MSTYNFKNYDPNLLILFIDVSSRKVVKSHEFYGHLGGAVKQADLLADSVKDRELAWEIVDRQTGKLELKNF